MHINVIYPGYIRSYGVGYACQSLAEAMNVTGVDVDLYSVTVDKAIRKKFHRLVMPPCVKSLGYRFLTEDFLNTAIEWKFRVGFKKNSIGYVWPGTSLATVKKLKKQGYVLCLESINTHQSTSNIILDKEYRRLGLNVEHGINANEISDEESILELVDYVFSPSDEVSKSLLNANVPAKKIISTSYGLKSTDIFSIESIEAKPRRTELTAIFVGRIGIRKGAHLLLEYWAKSGIKGKLKLVGGIEPDARHLIEPYLERSDVEHIRFVKDLQSVYMDADIFLFPSLEEGSPLVTYLALGAGLPCIVSPMGGGGIIDHDSEGLVADPHDELEWIESMRRVFLDVDLRSRLAKNAHNRAPSYLWSKVGEERVRILCERLLKSGNIS